MKIKVVKKKYKGRKYKPRTLQYPYKEMQPGQCMVITVEDGEDPSKIRNSVFSAAAQYGKESGCRFASEIEDNTVRLYRVS